MAFHFTITGASVLRPGGLEGGPLTIDGAAISGGPEGPRVDLSGFTVLPGIIDAHGDGFERHVARRRGAMMDPAAGIEDCAAELAANGITTAMLAQFYSWEGGLRSPDMAAQVLAAIDTANVHVPVDLKAQLRLETHMVDDYPAIEALIAKHAVPYVVFNDHLPHDALAKGKKPPRLTGTALKSGRSPEAHLALMQRLHESRDAVPEAVAALAARLSAAGVLTGSHDDATPEDWAFWHGLGTRISEFPLTRAAAQAARDSGAHIVLGAPNVTRGGSHNGNVSAAQLAEDGLCDALASDYHYPAPRRAALRLAERIGLERAWALVSERPARMLGLTDRGRLEPGLRADLVVMHPQTCRIAATISGGRIAYMAGAVAERFLAPLTRAGARG